MIRNRHKSILSRFCASGDQRPHCGGVLDFAKAKRRFATVLRSARLSGYGFLMKFKGMGANR